MVSVCSHGLTLRNQCVTHIVTLSLTFLPSLDNCDSNRLNYLCDLRFLDIRIACLFLEKLLGSLKGKLIFLCV